MASVRPPKRVPPTIPLPDSAWAYVAGILDGESCMRMEWYGGGKHSPHIQLIVDNTYEGLIDYLKATLGGWKVGPRIKGGNRANSWRWESPSIRARAILAGTLPYLVVKHRQAELILAFYEALPVYKESHPGRINKILHRDTIEEPLKSIFTELEALNRRGPDRGVIH
jgi:hypothetical protein